MKKVWLVVIFALLGTAVLGGYALLDNMFPMASPIDCPNAEDITKITLAQNDDTSIVVEAPIFAEILQKLHNTDPTRRWSVNDYPTAETYYTIELDTPVREYRYFIYVENTQVYVESPYEGIYRASQQFLDYIAEYFKN